MSLVGIFFFCQATVISMTGAESSAGGTANLITGCRHALLKLVSLKRQLSPRSNKADPHTHYKRGQAEPFQSWNLDCFLFSLSRFVLRHKNAATQ